MELPHQLKGVEVGSRFPKVLLETIASQSISYYRHPAGKEDGMHFVLFVGWYVMNGDTQTSHN